jgi:hypothetical protein
MMSRGGCVLDVGNATPAHYRRLIVQRRRTTLISRRNTAKIVFAAAGPAPGRPVAQQAGSRGPAGCGRRTGRAGRPAGRAERGAVSGPGPVRRGLRYRAADVRRGQDGDASRAECPVQRARIGQPAPFVHRHVERNSSAIRYRPGLSGNPESAFRPDWLADRHVKLSHPGMQRHGRTGHRYSKTLTRLGTGGNGGGAAAQPDADGGTACLACIARTGAPRGAAPPHSVTIQARPYMYKS